jgi:hypothetical protein
VTTFEEVRPVADAVLYEGYALYPYRANDAKNRVRWQFGVLVPERVAAVEPSERSRVLAQLLVEGRSPTLEVRARFLQVSSRTVQRGAGENYEDVAVLEAGDTAYLPFEEALARELDLPAAVRALVGGGLCRTFDVAGDRSVEAVPGGRLTRESRPLRVVLALAADPVEGPHGVTRLRVEVRNGTEYQGDVPAPREEALRSSLVAVHLVLRLEGGTFLSMTDPPEWASRLVAESPSEGLWPALAGAPGSRDMVLCSPIILPDHPQVAPESATAFFDATEMDEMLSLRTLTLTEEEKRAVRGTDPHTADLLRQVEGLPQDVLDRLHGAVRYLSATARRVEPGEQECRCGRGAGCCCDPVAGVPMRRTSSWRAARRSSPGSCTTSTERTTSPSCSRTTKAWTSPSPTGATSTSRRTRSSPWER